MNITNHYGLPRAIVDAVKNYFDNSYDYVPIENSISVTTLLKPPMIRHLSDLYKDRLGIDAIAAMDLMRGSSLHNIMELAGSSYIKELRVERLVTLDTGATFFVSGKHDLYDPVTKELIDYKDTSVYKFIFEPNGDPQYVWQLNILKWLLSSYGLEVKSAKLVYFLKDWQKNQYLRKPSDYPSQKVQVINAPLLDNDVIELYVQNRLEKHFESELQVCTPAERWREEDKWAVMGKTGTRAVNGGICKSKEEAEDLASKVANSGIEFRPGSDKRCLNYCLVRQYCEYGKTLEVE